MEPEIRNGPVEWEITGVSCRHDPGRSYGEEIISLLDRVWPRVRGARHDGINRVVYDNGGMVYAGVVVEGALPDGLERRRVRLGRHAYWKHVGPYRLIGATGDAMRAALARRGVQTALPMVEVYGHWTQDESRLETETLVAVR
ncbi:MAG: hypothetical protein IT437_14455 [Phycisphaerales bacterium]|nr:hypothetical protein [Phycisphaerales bacterium]